MNASRPEADIEYSRADKGSGGRSGRRAGSGEGGRAGPDGYAQHAVLALALVGAALLLAAEFTPLLHVRTIAAHPRLVHTVQTGSHHGYALVPIAALAAGLALAAWHGHRRLALPALAALGLAALEIALLADLPDAHATGIVGSPAHGLAQAQAHAALGLYLETLGAVLLLVAAATGLLLSGARSPRGEPTPA